jgi:hypothetical protein
MADSTEPSGMKRLVAHKQLFGDFGKVRRGEVFETDEETALALEARGLVSEYREPPLPADFMAKLKALPAKRARQ